jgi:hypothetical protein
MKKFLVVLAVISLTLFADNAEFEEILTIVEDNPVLIAQAPDVTKEYVPAEKASKDYFPPDPYEDNQGPFFTGEFLYWKTLSTRMPIAATDQLIPPAAGPGPGVGISMKTHEAKFGYDAGWRAGVGYRLPYRAWDFYGNWTHLNADAHKTVEPGPNQSVANIWGTLNLPSALDRSVGHQDLELNTFDFELGKTIHFTPPFMIRPFLGIKYAWIDQSLKVDNQLADLVPNTTRTHFHFDNDFRGIGLRFGFNTDWEIDKGFAVIGRAAYSLLWGKLRLNHKEHYEFLAPGGAVIVHDFDFPENRHIVQNVVELFAGLRWEKIYHHEKYRFRIQGGYEAQYWPSFNQLTRIAEVTNINMDMVFPFSGDLGFHGWTAGVRFDF